ncbi:hypothetical protein Scep_009763 [Stephania cephalantha]|uniref:Uncharacterized protein n=1 Tax=Stephania cephalantha TaxID=152367 RepID=A0AAP0JTV0_9MAGN
MYQLREEIGWSRDAHGWAEGRMNRGKSSRTEVSMGTRACMKNTRSDVQLQSKNTAKHEHG